MAGLSLLNDGQLRQLARVVYYKEAEAIQNIKFRSEPERAKYLRDSKAGYEKILGLLDAGGELKSKFQNDAIRDPIAEDIFSYVVYSVNFGLQCVRNCYLRLNYLNKIEEHAKFIIKGLEVLDRENATNVARLAKDASLYRNAMLEYTRKYQSTASRNFSKSLKERGIKFKDLLDMYKNKVEGLDPQVSFNNLDDVDKIKVYEAIIEASGRGNAIVNILSKALGVAGIAVLLFTAGMMVWDIFSSEHILQTATHDAVVTAASVGGAMVGEVVGAALATALVGAEASPLFVMMAGIITGIAGAFILGEFAGWLIDLIFGSGGSAPLSTDGHRCYVTPMPDGVTLARQIAHQSNP